MCGCDLVWLMGIRAWRRPRQRSRARHIFEKKVWWFGADWLYLCLFIIYIMHVVVKEPHQQSPLRNRKETDGWCFRWSRKASTKVCARCELLHGVWDLQWPRIGGDQQVKFNGGWGGVFGCEWLRLGQTRAGEQTRPCSGGVRRGNGATLCHYAAQFAFHCARHHETVVTFQAAQKTTTSRGCGLISCGDICSASACMREGIGIPALLRPRTLSLRRWSAPVPAGRPTQPSAVQTRGIGERTALPPLRVGSVFVFVCVCDGYAYPSVDCFEMHLPWWEMHLWWYMEFVVSYMYCGYWKVSSMPLVSSDPEDWCSSLKLVIFTIGCCLTIEMICVRQCCVNRV